VRVSSPLGFEAVVPVSSPLGSEVIVPVSLFLLFLRAKYIPKNIARPIATSVKLTDNPIFALFYL